MIEDQNACKFSFLIFSFSKLIFSTLMSVAHFFQVTWSRVEARLPSFCAQDVYLLFYMKRYFDKEDCGMLLLYGQLHTRLRRLASVMFSFSF